MYFDMFFSVSLLCMPEIAHDWLNKVFYSILFDGVWLLQRAQCGLGGSHFYTYNSGFPCAFICLSFMLMAMDFSRTQ